MEYKLQGRSGWYQCIIYNSSRNFKHPLCIGIMEGNPGKNKRVLYFPFGNRNCNDWNFCIAECISFLPFLGTHTHTDVPSDRCVGWIPKDIRRGKVCSFYAGWKHFYAGWNNCTLLCRW